MASTVMRLNAFLATFLFNFFSSGNIILNSVLYKSVENSEGFSNILTGLLFMLPYTTTRLFGKFLVLSKGICLAPEGQEDIDGATKKGNVADSIKTGWNTFCLECDGRSYNLRDKEGHE